MHLVRDPLPRPDDRGDLTGAAADPGSTGATGATGYRAGATGEPGQTRRATAADRVAANSGRRVIVLVCGEAERGDDGAAFRAVAALPPSALAVAEVRRCGTLEVDHLLAIGPDEACLVVDAAVGLPPGEIATGSLESLASRGRPRLVGEPCAPPISCRPRTSSAWRPSSVRGSRRVDSSGSAERRSAWAKASRQQ